MKVIYLVDIVASILILLVAFYDRRVKGLDPPTAQDRWKTAFCYVAGFLGLTLFMVYDYIRHDMLNADVVISAVRLAVYLLLILYIVLHFRKYWRFFTH